MTSRTITGNILDLTDSAVASGTVTFEKLVTSTTGNTIHQSGVDTATTDGSGDFSIDLAVPASGSYRYRMILPNGWSFYFSIAAGASVNVATLIIAETITDSDAIVEALAAYLQLSGGTMTGQLNFSGTTHAGIKLLSLTTAQRDALTPANGMVIYNSTTATAQVYQGGAWASVGGGGGASDVDDLTTATGQAGQYVRVDSLDADGLEYRDPSQVLSDIGAQASDADLTAIAALTPANDDVIQRKAGAWTNRTMAQLLTDLSTKLNAIDALTWAANSIILLTGTATASVQALAAHIVTFLQSASAADARTAIGAGTGDGDVTGPASSVDNQIARFDLTTGKIVQAGTNAPTYDDNGNIALVGNQYLSSTTFRSSSTFASFKDQFGSATTLQIDHTNRRIGVGANVTPQASAHINLADAGTTTSPHLAILSHSSTGTPGAGFGAALAFQLETSTTDNTDAGRVVTLWNTATHASRVPDMVAYLTDSAAEREIWRGRATGSAAAIGFLGATPVARAAHIADAAGDDAATVNAILVVLENLGFIATS